MSSPIRLTCFLLCFVRCSTLPMPNQPLETYLQGRIPLQNGRYKTFLEALRLMDKHAVKTIVETGTERWQEARYCFDGDGGSTIIFADWATKNNAQMFSVDINPTHIEYCRNNTKQYSPQLTLVLGDSVEFLRNFRKQIDFLYMDSYDYSEDDPEPAQLHCLNEIKAAENKLTRNAIVMIDDCNIQGGGKGALAIQWLIKKGWYIHRNKHQVILLRR